MHSTMTNGLLVIKFFVGLCIILWLKLTQKCSISYVTYKCIDIFDAFEQKGDKVKAKEKKTETNSKVDWIYLNRQAYKILFS